MVSHRLQSPTRGRLKHFQGAFTPNSGSKLSDFSVLSQPWSQPQQLELGPTKKTKRFASCLVRKPFSDFWIDFRKLQQAKTTSLIWSHKFIKSQLDKNPDNPRVFFRRGWEITTESHGWYFCEASSKHYGLHLWTRISAGQYLPTDLVSWVKVYFKIFSPLA